MSLRKLILQNGWSPGDLVMLSAAVRDLQKCYPDRFQVDVRTACPQVWEHNPHIIPLDENDPDVQVIDCSYPLINSANRRPYHCLHGFIQFLNERLDLRIEPTVFKGDIHLSAQEKAWYSQVHELAGEDVPFWIICAGGKHDVTIKWWSHERYQQVVDHYQGRILFVQVGARGHHHPKLEGAVDLRGQTDLRQLIRLVYHSQGIVCGITALMHLAAAVETRSERASLRPCVVVAGGREPVHWEAYPGHQFLHTIGALECCRYTGCWKDRTFPLGDGDHRDLPRHRCVDVVGILPRCMDMISTEEVCRAIDRYFVGGVNRFLNASERRAAVKAVQASQTNTFDEQPLNFQTVRRALGAFLASMPKLPFKRYEGRGIVICAGGARYFTCAWVNIRMLRQHGCRLPIQVWYLGTEELSPSMIELLKTMDVECVDAEALMMEEPVRRMGGWELKSYASLHCPFAEVLFLDADNVPIRNPEYLFEATEFKRTGAVFWPDYGTVAKRTIPVWRACGMRPPGEKEFESGQMMFDKNRCWRALRLSLWFNEHSDFFFRHTHGDKETFHFAFRKLRAPYHLIATPIESLAGIMCQHDFDGKRVFQHRNSDKWNLLIRHRRVRGFRLEADCRRHLEDLRSRWDGDVGRIPELKRGFGRIRTPKIRVVLTGQNSRLQTRLRDVETVVVDPAGDHEPGISAEVVLRCAKKLNGAKCDYVLFLEPGVEVNRFLIENLLAWEVLRTGSAMVASLSNPGFVESACSQDLEVLLMKPETFVARGAFLVRQDVFARLIRSRTMKKADLRSAIVRLVRSDAQPLFQHVPSLVRVTNGRYQTHDFDAAWRHESL